MDRTQCSIGLAAPRARGPLSAGLHLTIAFNMSQQQTTFVQRHVLLMWRSEGDLEGWGVGGGGRGVGVKPHRSAYTVGGEQSTQKKSVCGRKRVDVVGMHKKVEMGETKV